MDTPVPDLRDYDWIDNTIPDTVCLSIITDISIDWFLSSVPNPVVVDRCSFATLDDRGMDIFGEYTPGGAQGLLEVGGAVVMFESNGYHGETNALMAPLSVERSVVSHYMGGQGRSSFNWWTDGDYRSRFEPPFADGREGTQPDALVPLMRSIGGFRLDHDPESDDRSWLELPYRQAAFALGEALTGVRLTAEVLRESTYLSVDIPLPD